MKPISKINILFFFIYYFLGYEIGKISGIASLVIVSTIPLLLEMLISNFNGSTLVIPYRKPLPALLLFLVFITIVGVYNGLPIMLSAGTLLYYLIIFFYLNYIFRNYAERYEEILKRFFWSITLTLFVIIIPFLTTARIALGGFYQVATSGVYLPFFDSNFTLPFINSMVLLGSFILLRKQNKSWLYVLCVTILIHLLLLRRGAILFTILAFLVYKLNIRPILIIVASVVTPFIVYFLFYDFFVSLSLDSSSMLEVRGNTEKSNLERVGLFIITMTTFFGYEILSASALIGDLSAVKDLREGVEFFHVHNSYLNTLIYFGLVGLLGLIWVLSQTSWKIRFSRLPTAVKAHNLGFIYLIFQINTESLFVNINFLNLYFLFSIVALSFSQLQSKPMDSDV